MLTKMLESFHTMRAIICNTPAMTFQSWMMIAHAICLCVLCVIGIVTILAIWFAIPLAMYRTIFKRLNQKMKMATTIVEADAIIKHWKIAKLIFWCCFTIGYLPTTTAFLLLIIL